MSEMHKLTSYSDGFGIFNKIAEHEFDVDNKNYLRLFMLNTENKLFNYDELYEYLLPNIARYVFDRKKLAEAEKDPIKQSLILVEAINHLRKITSDKDRGAGGELGEVLLYLFLVTTLANRFTNSLIQPLGTVTYRYWAYRYGLMGWKTNQPPKNHM